MSLNFARALKQRVEGRRKKEEGFFLLTNKKRREKKVSQLEKV
jgi:hypothetical protein